MATCIAFYGDEYIAWKLDMSEQLIDGEREPGCLVNRFDDDRNDILGEQYIIAKGNVLENCVAKW